MPRGEAGRFDDLLSVEDVERLVSSGALRYPAFRLVKEGGQIPLGSYTRELGWRPDPFTRVAEPARIAEEFGAGATIVLQALHYNWPPLARFCRELEAQLGHPLQANSYYTPRRSQGFAVHHDTHDVLVLQVAGEKQWLVYEPVFELPLKHQRWSAELGDPGRPVLELTLRAGDTLYMPRGWPHEALTSDTDSLHITVGINVHTWVDAVRAALDDCEGEVAFRRTVRDDGEAPDELLDLLRARLAAPDVVRRRRRRFVDTRRAVLDGQVQELRKLDSLTALTPVERRPTVIWDLDGATLSFEGKHLRFPEHVRTELEAAVAADAPFSAAELPGDLDESGRLVLVKRLIREGFLRRSGEGE